MLRISGDFKVYSDALLSGSQLTSPASCHLPSSQVMSTSRFGTKRPGCGFTDFFFRKMWEFGGSIYHRFGRDETS